MITQSGGPPPAGTRTDVQSRIHPFPLLLVAFASAFVAWVIADDTRLGFGDTPEYLTWILLFIAQFVVWGCGLVLALVDVRQLWAPAKMGLGKTLLDVVALAGFVALALVFLPALGLGRDDVPFGSGLSTLPSSADEVLDHQRFSLTIVALCGIGVATIAVFGLLLARRAFLEIGASAGTVRGADLEAFGFVRRRLLRLLAIAGLAIGIGTLTIGAMREALEAAQDPSPRAAYCKSLEDKDQRDLEYCEGVEAGPLTPKAFDRQFVILFGLYYTALLMLAYAPAYAAFLAAGRTLVGRALKPPLTNPTTFVTRQELRDKLESAMQLNVGAGANFKAGVAIFGPVFGSLVGIVLGTD